MESVTLFSRVPRGRTARTSAGRRTPGTASTHTAAGWRGWCQAASRSPPGHHVKAVDVAEHDQDAQPPPVPLARAAGAAGGRHRGLRLRSRGARRRRRGHPRQWSPTRRRSLSWSSCPAAGPPGAGPRTRGEAPVLPAWRKLASTTRGGATAPTTVPATRARFILVHPDRGQDGRNPSRRCATVARHHVGTTLLPHEVRERWSVRSQGWRMVSEFGQTVSAAIGRGPPTMARRAARRGRHGQRGG